MNRKWIIDFYKDENGQSPIDKFLDSLPIKQRAKVIRTIQLLEEFGINLKGPYCDYMGDGMYELRTKISTNIHRVFYFHFEEGQFILLHGFTKKTQKTPRREIETAKKRKEDFLNRHKKEMNRYE